MFIDWFQKDKPERLEAIAELIYMAQHGELFIVTSTLTITEVIKEPRQDVPDPVMESVADFFKNHYIVPRTPDFRVSNLARKLRIESLAPSTKKLQLPDAVHAATAIIHGVKEIHTYDDKDLIKKDGLLSADGKTFLKICNPRHPNPPKQPLFDSLTNA